MSPRMQSDEKFSWPKHDMVKERDAEKLTNLLQLARHGEIFRRRSWVATRVIVDTDEALRAFARMSPLKTSRGCTMVEFSVPTETSSTPRRRLRGSSASVRNRSLGPSSGHHA